MCTVSPAPVTTGAPSAAGRPVPPSAGMSGDQPRSDRDAGGRDRDAGGRPRNARPRDALGRPLDYGSAGAPRPPEEPAGTPAESLGRAQRLLDAGRPFEAHEVLEDAWKAAPAGERELWRGLAQLAVGLTHAARGNRSGAAALITRGAGNMAGYRDGPPHRVDVAGLLAWAATAGTALTEGAGAEGVGAEGVVAEGAGAEGAGVEGAGVEGAAGPDQILPIDPQPFETID